MAIGFGVACPKGTPPKTLKRRLARAEAKVAAWCRAQCVARDGGCVLHHVARLFNGIDDVVPGKVRDAVVLGDRCSGPAAWAHAHERRRSKTRGLDPTVRHDPMHSFMACTRVHEAYDAKRIAITPLTRKGFNGPVKFTVTR